MTVTREEHVVVSGASSGIGRATALALARAGYTVFAGIRSPGAGLDLLRDAAAAAQRIVPLTLDVAEPASVAAAADLVRARLAGKALFALVNNAGVANGGALLYQPQAQFRALFEVNLFGTLRAIQAFAPLLLTPQTRRARIVNVGSVAGGIGVPFLGAYSASKHAIEGLSESLRRELGIFNIDVVVVAPGVVATPIWEKSTADGLDYVRGTPYEPFADRIREYFVQEGLRGSRPEAVAELIRQVMDAKRPKPRYAPVKGKFLNWILPRYLPKRLVDFYIRRRLGIG